MSGFLAKPKKAVIFHFKLCADFYLTPFSRIRSSSISLEKVTAVSNLKNE